jgi:hypothetical protein
MITILWSAGGGDALRKFDTSGYCYWLVAFSLFCLGVALGYSHWKQNSHDEPLEESAEDKTADDGDISTTVIHNPLGDDSPCTED